ncbi:MAG: hypothetical protein ABJC61_12935 [Acidobacteriota bacterium]
MISETDFPREFIAMCLRQPGTDSLIKKPSSNLGHELGDRLVVSPDRAMRLAYDTRELLAMEVPSISAATRSGQLFDLVAGSLWRDDHFGERNELCALLAFVAWRNAAAQGLERESQEWLRIVEFIVTEKAVDFECLESFLYLSEQELTPKLELRFLAKPEDIFIALAILKRDRNRRAKAVMCAAIAIYRRIVTVPVAGATEVETQFFLGEAAHLAGAISRLVGRRKTTSQWLTTALSHFERCSAREPLVARVKLSLSVHAQGSHEHEESERWRRGLFERFVAWGMAREAFTFRLVELVILKDRGVTEPALKALSELADDLRDASEPSLLAATMVALGDLVCGSGASNSGFLILQEALALATGVGDVFTSASACITMGDRKANRGESVESIEWFNAGLRAAESSGSPSLLAYFRVVVADELVARSINDEARVLLTLAIPVLREETMIPESIHAIKLLRTIDGSSRPSRRSDKPTPT